MHAIVHFVSKYDIKFSSDLETPIIIFLLCFCFGGNYKKLSIH